MKMSRSLIPTLREDPKDAEVISHKLLVRAGFIRKVSTGVYTLLPLGLKTIGKLISIVRDEMERAGAIEIQMPIVQPKDLWASSGRWEVYGKELLRFRDRKDQEFCLAPTHEEVVTDLVKNEVHSYRQLPLILYQIHTKFRDEIRPRFGLMRAREFLMKDAYSFDVSEDCSRQAYETMYAAYERIFQRIGLKFEAVEADTGSIGGSLSHEFQVLAPSGEDRVARCNGCKKAWNAELAPIAKPRFAAPRSSTYKVKVKVKTGEAATIEEVAAFLGIQPHLILKSLLIETERGPYLAVIRGDRVLSLPKLKRSLDVREANLAQDLAGLPEGQIGPVDQNLPIIADNSILGIQNGVAGANEPGHHWVNVNYPMDFEAHRLSDFTLAQDGDSCGICEEPLALFKGIEVGQVFYLGTKYSKPMEAVFLDAEGNKKPTVMGCYGIGIGRTVAATVEQCHDDKGICWPLSLAPFAVHLVLLDTKQSDLVLLADSLYTTLLEQGVEVLYDDREERPGVKFHDADLIGLPLRLTIGKKYKEKGLVEIKARDSSFMEDFHPEDAVKWIHAFLSSQGKGNRNG